MNIIALIEKLPTGLAIVLSTLILLIVISVYLAKVLSNAYEYTLSFSYKKLILKLKSITNLIELEESVKYQDSVLNELFIYESSAIYSLVRIKTGFQIGSIEQFKLFNLINKKLGSDNLVLRKISKFIETKNDNFILLPYRDNKIQKWSFYMLLCAFVLSITFIYIAFLLLIFKQIAFIEFIKNGIAFIFCAVVIFLAAYNIARSYVSMRLYISFIKKLRKNIKTVNGKKIISN